MTVHSRVDTCIVLCCTNVLRCNLNPVMTVHRRVYCAVHCVHYLRWEVYQFRAALCYELKLVFLYRAYTPKAGRLRCFHPSFVSVLMALCVRPSQRGTTGQEEDEENGWEENAYVLLCLFGSTRHMTSSDRRWKGCGHPFKVSLNSL